MRAIPRIKPSGSQKLLKDLGWHKYTYLECLQKNQKHSLSATNLFCIQSSFMRTKKKNMVFFPPYNMATFGNNKSSGMEQERLSLSQQILHFVAKACNKIIRKKRKRLQEVVYKRRCVSKSHSGGNVLNVKRIICYILTGMCHCRIAGQKSNTKCWCLFATSRLPNTWLTCTILL